MTNLTGRTYHKQTLFGLVLMVEYIQDRGHSADTYHWRKANGGDLVYLKEKFSELKEQTPTTIKPKESVNDSGVNEIRFKLGLHPIVSEESIIAALPDPNTYPERTIEIYTHVTTLHPPIKSVFVKKIFTQTILKWEKCNE